MGEALLAVVKRDCPTCRLVAPVLARLSRAWPVEVYSQDDPSFPDELGGARDDTSLERSHRLGIHTVPTLIRLDEGGGEVGRVEGWDRESWEALVGVAPLGEGLPLSQPGCGARNVEPGMPERLALRLGEVELDARRVSVADADDPVEIAYDRGWTDGLPIVAPTELRVVRMLAATSRDATEVIGEIPPNLSPCTIEKAAINAVMAGCRPEYFPVVLSVIEAALIPEFAMHGLLCTLYVSGPVVIVNGPVARRIGMNWGFNALGQGNRANATIGRALQLVIRNVGGGRPGEVDRAILGNPGKYTFCFAEDETDPDWQPLSVARGLAPGTSGVTLFHGDGVTAFFDLRSRTAAELTRSLASALWSVAHPKASTDWVGGALVVLCPDHYEVYRSEGWGRAEIEDALWDALRRPASEVAAGVGGIPVGVDPALGETPVDKFHRESFLVVRAGGRGGGISAVVGGWPGQRNPAEIRAVTKEITG